MRALASRMYETGVRIGLFSDSTSDAEADEGYTSLVKREKDVVEAMRVVAMAQRAGLLDKAAGAAEKARLSQEARSGPLTALAEVAKRAQGDHRDVAMQFRYKPGQRSYIAFESAARSMLKAAEDHKDVLVPYGLSGTVTASLTELLDRFAKARELCDQGRIAHKTATQQLDALAQDLGSIIRTMDARNRVVQGRSADAGEVGRGERGARHAGAGAGGGCRGAAGTGAGGGSAGGGR